MEESHKLSAKDFDASGEMRLAQRNAPDQDQKENN
jgi:hypothetical protein